jgi:hypothetical protein
MIAYPLVFLPEQKRLSEAKRPPNVFAKGQVSKIRQRLRGQRLVRQET